MPVMPSSSNTRILSILEVGSTSRAMTKLANSESSSLLKSRRLILNNNELEFLPRKGENLPDIKIPIIEKGFENQSSQGLFNRIASRKFKKSTVLPVSLSAA